MGATDKRQKEEAGPDGTSDTREPEDNIPRLSQHRRSARVMPSTGIRWPQANGGNPGRMAKKNRRAARSWCGSLGGSVTDDRQATLKA